MKTLRENKKMPITRFKAVTGDTIELAQKIEYVCDRLENIVGT